MSCCKKSIAAQVRTQAIQTVANSRQLMLHIQKWRQPDDRGLGDTLQHVAAYFGADKFSQWLSKWGIDCQCDNERDYWNEKHPYVTPSE